MLIPHDLFAVYDNNYILLLSMHVIPFQVDASKDGA